MKPFSLYVHIPFCLRKCPYCDFNTYAVSQIPEEEYLTALLCELDFYAAQAEWDGRPIQTVYFGGGTPSIFSPQSYERFFWLLRERFELLGDCEITLEANPYGLAADKLEGYLECGMNRLSLGSQSFSAEILETLGRLHKPQDIRNSFELARTSGYSNISLDLIFGIPGQTIHDLKSDIQSVIDIGADHVSAYSLTYEKGTPFYQARARGVLKELKQEDVAEMMECLIATLTSTYTQYEVSNYSKEEKESRHNMAYWNRDDYLGLGAGAHSYFRNNSSSALRWSNYAAPKEYMERAAAFGQTQSWTDSLSKNDLMFEFFFLGLRRIDGVNEEEFREEFNEDIETKYSQKLQDLLEEHYIIRQSGQIQFTRKGLFVGDSILEHFVL